MTVQTKRFIELADIIGLRLECKTCGNSISLGNSEKNEAVDFLLGQANTLHKCPLCQNQWTNQFDSGGDSDIKAFFRALRELRTLEKNFGCSLKLEITGADKQ